MDPPVERRRIRRHWNISLWFVFSFVCVVAVAVVVAVAIAFEWDGWDEMDSSEVEYNMQCL